MPGTQSGSVDHRTNVASPANANQEYFTNLFRFFNGPLRSGSYVDLVALQTGSSAGGTNFHDQNNSFGENAFACFRVRSGSVPGAGVSTRRAVDYYVLFQWADAAAFGASPGNPGTINGGTTDGTAIAVAWRDDGLSPWNGTTLANGNDTKGSSVWTAGTSSLTVFPRSNNTGGSHNTNKENMMRLQDLSIGGTTYRYHFIADRDCFITFTDEGDNLDYDSIYIHGTFEPLSGFITSSGGNMQMPMFQLGADNAGSLAVATSYGGTAGTANTNGGITGARLSGGARARDLRIDRYSNNLLANTSLQPNPQFIASRFDEFRIPVMVFETPDFGHVGYIDSLTEVYNASVHDITSGSTKAIFGPTAGGTIEYVVPWSGSAPGSTSTREGRYF